MHYIKIHGIHMDTHDICFFFKAAIDGDQWWLLVMKWCFLSSYEPYMWSFFGLPTRGIGDINQEGRGHGKRRKIEPLDIHRMTEFPDFFSAGFDCAHDGTYHGYGSKTIEFSMGGNSSMFRMCFCCNSWSTSCIHLWEQYTLTPRLCGMFFFAKTLGKL